MTHDNNPSGQWTPSDYQPSTTTRFGQQAGADDPQLPPESSGPRNRPAAIVAFWIGLFFTWLIMLGQQPAGHLMRVSSTCLAVGVGFTAGVALLRRRSWPAGLGGMVVGVALAAAAWWFVPTDGGLSLWSARQERDRHLANLEALPAEDGAGFLREDSKREQLMAQFPQLRPDIEGAERGWGLRRADALVAELNALPAGDGASLRKVRAGQQRWLQRFVVVRSRVEEAERDWAARTVAAGMTEVEPLLKDDPARATARLQQLTRDLAELGRLGSVEDQLLAARRRATQARLEAARRQAQALLAADRYQALGELGEQLARDLAAEAEAVGVQAELEKFRHSCGAFADLARQAGKNDP